MAKRLNQYDAKTRARLQRDARRIARENNVKYRTVLNWRRQGKWRPFAKKEERLPGKKETPRTGGGIPSGPTREQLESALKDAKNENFGNFGGATVFGFNPNRSDRNVENPPYGYLTNEEISDLLNRPTEEQRELARKASYAAQNHEKKMRGEEYDEYEEDDLKYSVLWYH